MSKKQVLLVYTSFAATFLALILLVWHDDMRGQLDYWTTDVKSARQNIQSKCGINGEELMTSAFVKISKCLDKKDLMINDLQELSLK